MNLISMVIVLGVSYFLKIIGFCSFEAAFLPVYFIVTPLEPVIELMLVSIGIGNLLFYTPSLVAIPRWMYLFVFVVGLFVASSSYVIALVISYLFAVEFIPAMVIISLIIAIISIIHKNMNNNNK